MFIRILLVAGVVLGLNGAVQAAALYTLQTTAVLTLTGVRDAGGALISLPADLVITGDAYLGVNQKTTSGNATAQSSSSAVSTAAAFPQLNVGESLVQQVALSGQALALPASASTDVRTTGLIALENQSLLASYTALFTLAYTATGQVAVDSPPIDAATLTRLLRLQVDTFADGNTLLDIHNILAGTDSSQMTTNLDFAITLAPGESAQIDLYSDGAGSAQVIGDPSTLALVLLGWPLLLGRR